MISFLRRRPIITSLKAYKTNGLVDEFIAAQPYS